MERQAVRLAALLPLEVELFWDAIIVNSRKGRLLDAIDEALDARDAEAFYWLAAQLQQA